MKMLFYAVAILTTTVFLSITAYAQEKPPTTESLYGGDAVPLGQRMACNHDIQTFCSNYAAKAGDADNDGQLFKCLRSNEGSLSDSCLKTLNDNNPDWSNPHN